MKSSEPCGLLEGIRVVDVTRALAGPYCTMLLGDQGAEVIKIEQPVVGDSTRHQSNPVVGGENTAFLATNRNKKGICLDLKNPRAQDLAYRLIADADVFVENYRPGTAERLGLGWEKLHALNPRLIYCSISGWGSDGPYAERGGVASAAEAVAGLMSVTGDHDGAPVKVGVSIVDNLGGLFAKDAITAALFARERSGHGQRVEASLLESTVAILSMSAYSYLMAGLVPERMGSEHAFIVPWRNFRTLDGYVFVTAGRQSHWERLCKALEREDLLTDERFATAKLRTVHRNELYSALDEIFPKHPTEYWVTKLSAEGVVAAPVNTIDQVFQDPQVLHRQMLESVEHTTLGRIPQVGHAEKFSLNPASIRLPPPILGEHTSDVLRELAGCSASEVRELHEAGVSFSAELTS